VCAAQRAYRESNLEKVRAQERARDNPEKRRARDRAYHARNREARVAANKAWRLANQERYAQYQREYYQVNRGKIQSRAHAWARDFPAQAREHRRLNMMRRRARLRALPSESFTLEELWSRPGASVCYLCDTQVAPDDFHVDHLIPIAAGATDLELAGIVEHPGSTFVNAALTHPTCNKSKGRRVLPAAVAKYRRNVHQLNVMETATGTPNETSVMPEAG
jgi:hypothetical protein